MASSRRAVDFAADDNPSSRVSDQAKPIQVESVRVKAGRLVCDIRIPCPRHRTVTPALAAHARNSVPTLARHTCVNGVSDTFDAVLDTASIPHMLEHLAIDAQTRNAHDADAVFVGTTEWLDESTGKARISLSFTDDLEALRAFNEAVIFLNDAVITYCV